MKSVVIIPSRYGSTRLAGKPLQDINGKTMVRWVYESAKRAKLPDEVVVATDDERIVREVENFGGKAVMTSSECRTGTERVSEAARLFEAGIIVNVQGDEPLMEPSIIDGCIRPLIEDSKIVMSTPVTPIKSAEEFFNPNVVKAVLDKDGFALYFSRSPVPHPMETPGEVPKGALKHLGLYAYRKEFLFEFAAMEQTGLELAERLEQLRVLENGFRIKAVETPYSPVAVDTQEDLDRVRKIAAARR